MGIREKIKRVVPRIGAVVLVFAAAFVVPWWLTVIFGAAGVALGVFAVELLIIGIILDLFLVPDTFGFFGFFFAPLFLAILLVRFLFITLRQ